MTGSIREQSGSATARWISAERGDPLRVDPAAGLSGSSSRMKSFRSSVPEQKGILVGKYAAGAKKVLIGDESSDKSFGLSALVGWADQSMS